MAVSIAGHDDWHHEGPKPNGLGVFCSVSSELPPCRDDDRIICPQVVWLPPVPGVPGPADGYADTTWGKLLSRWCLATDGLSPEGTAVPVTVPRGVSAETPRAIAWLFPRNGIFVRGRCKLSK